MDEKILYEGKPSNKLFWSWSIKATIILLVVLLFLSPMMFVDAGSKGAIYFDIVFALLIYLVVLIFLKVQIDTYRYKITDKGIYFNGGFLTKREKFVPFYKITNVDVLQTFVDQMFGISRLGFQTAGQGAANIPEITFQGLTDAKKPKEIALKMIEKNSK
jgi:uncharacterized membrane protein YdbT with pleckstrin-like domain